MFDILDTVNNWLIDDDSIYLATVISAWGSAPRSVGGKMAFRHDLSIIGSVSGGCVENAVIEEGLALKQKTGRFLSYGISNSEAWDVGLSCGGELEVFVEKLNQDWWNIYANRVVEQATTYAITILDCEYIGEKIVLDDRFQTIYETPYFPETIREQIQDIVKDIHRPISIVCDNIRIFVDVCQPQPHLVIVGGSHIAMPLHKISCVLGFRVSVIDPRSAFATPERFPEAGTILHSYPDKAFKALNFNQQTYLAILTHDPKIDDVALLSAFETNIPYIGLLSSRKTHEIRKKRLIEMGVSENQLARLHTPVGINIHSKTPEEIALSIIAEIVSVRNTNLNKL